MTTLSVIVTGATGGIGRATSLACARRGHTLVLVGRNSAKLIALADECRLAGAREVQHVRCDFNDSVPLEELQERLSGVSAPLVLINNAGSAHFGKFHELPLGKSLGLIDVSLKGALSMTHALLPAMLKDGKGTVLNVLSVAASHTFPDSEAYSVSKAGMHAFSKCLATSYPHLRVIGLVLGATDTPLWDDLAWSPQREDMLRADEVATKIVGVIEESGKIGYEEVTLLPPKGIL